MTGFPETIGPEDLLQIYRLGCFPMANSADQRGFSIVEPKNRGLIPIDLHIPKRLRRTIRHHPFEVRINTDFETVIRACATARPETWINEDIEYLFICLHQMGYAHSVECWRGGQLVGGLYGLAIGGVFCGESMFSIETDASKTALVHLCARLKRGGFSVLDAQFHNPHLEQFGLYEVPQADYLEKLEAHMFDPTDFVQKDIAEEVLLDGFLE